MDAAYAALRRLTVEELKEVWRRAHRADAPDLLLRHQVAFTLLRKVQGRW